MGNVEALRIIERLSADGAMTADETACILDAIDKANDTDEATAIRRHIGVFIDFAGIKSRGRPRHQKVTGADISTGRIKVRCLERAIIEFWKDRAPNNALMGRLLAVFAHKNYISIAHNIEQAAAYASRLVSGKWDIKQIRRAYSETMERTSEELDEIARQLLPDCDLN